MSNTQTGFEKSLCKTSKESGGLGGSTDCKASVLYFEEDGGDTGILKLVIGGLDVCVDFAKES